jgi:DNA-binding transcriptional MocR family regulator
MTLRAAQAGVTVYPLSALQLAAGGRNGIILGFAAFREEEIKEGVQKLAQAWGK